MIAAPPLADFAMRLAFGLASSLLATSWRAVPLPFFRTLSQISLGLLVLAALDQARAAGSSWALSAIVAGAVLAYFSSIAWGLGLPKLGLAMTALVALLAAAWFLAASSSPALTVWAVNSASRAASGFLLGATLSAMLLGHYYLTAPTMTVDPLKRAVAVLGGGLFARALLALAALLASQQGALGPGIARSDPSGALFLSVRWGLGIAAAGIATYMTWKTAEIRSTQSATGILYIAMIFVCFGELTSLVLAGREGLIC
jgi:hypothetical protein